MQLPRHNIDIYLNATTHDQLHIYVHIASYMPLFSVALRTQANTYIGASVNFIHSLCKPTS